MNCNLVRIAHITAVIFVVCAAGSPASGVETYTAKTNWLERSITNVIEVSVPVNHFVNEYHTNHVERFRTNLVNLFTTNLLTRTSTNRIVVEAFRTNHVDAYKTNWVNRVLTNEIVVDAYTTNRRTLNVTNWETVIVMKTNWITHPVTNVVQIDLIAKGTSPIPKEAGAETAAQTVSTSKEGLVLEASRTARVLANNNAEVQVRVKSNSETESPLQVLKWKVEREDGTFLSFGQDREFNRDLPLGRYKVEARIQGQAGTPVQVLRGTLEVTPRQASILQQKLFGQN